MNNLFPQNGIRIPSQPKGKLFSFDFGEDNIAKTKLENKITQLFDTTLSTNTLISNSLIINLFDTNNTKPPSSTNWFYEEKQFTVCDSGTSNTDFRYIQSIFNICKSCYNFINESEIDKFLYKYKYFLTTLLECYNEISKLIKDDLARIDLELSELDSLTEALFLTVRVKNSHKCLEYLNLIEDEWLLDLEYKIRKHLFIKCLPI